jgi:hypothetical protein
LKQPARPVDGREEAGVTRDDRLGGDDARPHRVFLLRVWRAGATWRASLEETRTGRRQGFADLAGLLAFLDAPVDDRTILHAFDAQGDDA